MFYIPGVNIFDYIMPWKHVSVKTGPNLMMHKMYKSVAVNLVSGVVNGKSCTLDTRNRVFYRLMIFWYGMQYIFGNPKDVPITLTAGVTISWPTFLSRMANRLRPG